MTRSHAGRGPLLAALKETCRIAGGTVPLWPYHRARLAAGGCGDALLDAIEAQVVETAAQWAETPTRRARITVVVEPSGGFAVDAARSLSSLDVIGGPLVARVDVAGARPLPAGPAKPANRSWWDEAHRRARQLKAHQAVIVGPDGGLIDGSTATLWIAEDGALFTPPSPPAIPGVGRAFVLASAEHAGLGISVEQLTWERFEAAEEAFLTNAFGGAVAIRGRGGELFVRVVALFADAWRGTTAQAG